MLVRVRMRVRLRLGLQRVLEERGMRLNKWNEELEVIEINLDYEYKDYLCGGETSNR